MRYFSLIIFAIAVAAAGSSHAAPQILGLIATNGAATPLHCDGKECVAQFSTFCLQKARSTPQPATPYRLVDESPVTFVVTGPNGTQRTVPASNLTIRSYDTYASVLISVPADQIRALGGDVALRVDDGATLVPVPQADDPNPITKLEIDLAKRELRSIGSRMVDQAGTIADAVRLSMRVMNAVSERRVNSELTQVRDRAARVLAAEDIDPKARELLRRRLVFCSNIVEDRWTAGSLRVCMRGQHAKLIDSLNWPYWDATGAGM
ncbi:MAG: hypothetical protein MJE12_03630 [Alphaproteobacteria bacterium]|nr:hypothetical protein [Alphaproteobacteria bacterium]